MNIQDKLPTILSAIGALITSIFSGFNAYNSQQISEKIAESRRAQDFSQRISEKIDILAGKDTTKARLTLAALYVMTEDANDKQHILNLGWSSQNPSLISLATILIDNDCRNQIGGKKEERSNLEELCRKSNNLASVSSTLPILEAAASAASSEESQAKLNQAVSQAKQAQVTLTKSVNEVEDLEGYMYLGKADFSKSFANDRTIDKIKVPSKGNTFKTTTNIYLRTLPTTENGTSTGVIPSHISIRAEDIIRGKTLKGGYTAYWAKVRLPKGLLREQS